MSYDHHGIYNCNAVPSTSPTKKKYSIQKKMLIIQIVWRKSAGKTFKETPFQAKRFGRVRSHRFEMFIVKFIPLP